MSPEKLKALGRENRELRQANEILRKDEVILASAYFANFKVKDSRSTGIPSGCLHPEGARRPPIQTMIEFIDGHKELHGHII